VQRRFPCAGIENGLNDPVKRNPLMALSWENGYMRAAV
jgi:hypothetical protein